MKTLTLTVTLTLSGDASEEALEALVEAERQNFACVGLSDFTGNEDDPSWVVANVTATVA